MLGTSVDCMIYFYFCFLLILFVDASVSSEFLLLFGYGNAICVSDVLGSADLLGVDYHPFLNF